MITLSKKEKGISLVAQLIAALIMLQTLYFKFTADPESVWIFSQIGMESWGRYLTGVVELIASILLFIPPLTWLGALIGLGTMAGATLFHLTVIGLDVMDDHGQLFAYALITLACCAVILFIHRMNIPVLNKVIKTKMTY